MSIRVTGSNYLDAYTMYSDLYSKNSTATDTTSKTTGNDTSAATQTGNLLTTQGREELQKALDAMKQAGYTRFTFSDVEDYRKQLESQFSSAVKSDLTEMGLAPDTEFNLELDSGGNLRVVANSTDKNLIEEYFADNPEMVNVFKNIQSLSNLKKAQQRSPEQAAEYTRNAKLSLQAEAVTAFFTATEAGNSNYFSQIAAFGSDGATTYLLGLNQSV